MARSARAVRASGFFTCCASSATTSPHATSASAAAVPTHDAVGGEHHLVAGNVVEVAVAAVVAPHGNGRARTVAISRSQLPSSEVGQTTSVGTDTGPARVPVQVQGDELDRLAQAHVVGEAAAETERAHLGQPGQTPPLVGAEGGLEAAGFGELACGLEPAEAVGECRQRRPRRRRPSRHRRRSGFPRARPRVRRRRARDRFAVATDRGAAGRRRPTARAPGSTDVSPPPARRARLR